jgi:hypothetical protein
VTQPFCPAGSCPFRDECAGQNRVAMAALIYAAHGFAVYPASQWSPAQHHSIGQLPRGEGGWKIATTDIETVRDGWRDQWTAPDVNVGVATGRISRLVVVDIDEPEPEMQPGATYGEMVTSAVAADDVRKWASEYGVVLPGNAVVASPSVGHVQVWVRMPEDSRFLADDVPSRTNWLRSKVDLLWDRHMVKAPPSVRAARAKKIGGEYRFERGCPCQVPDADDALLQALAETGSVGSAGRNGSDSTGEMTDRLDADGMIAEGIPVGSQNDGLHRLACSFAAKRKPPSEALAALVATVARSPVGDPRWPWELDDLQSLVERAYDFIARDRQTWVDLASKIKIGTTPHE